MLVISLPGTLTIFPEHVHHHHASETLWLTTALAVYSSIGIKTSIQSLSITSIFWHLFLTQIIGPPLDKGSIGEGYRVELGESPFLVREDEVKDHLFATFSKFLKTAAVV